MRDYYSKCLVSICLFVFLSGAFISCSHSEKNSKPNVTASSIEIRNYSEAIGRLSTINPGFVIKTIMGDVNYSGKAYPVYLLRIIGSGESEKTGAKNILITAGVHGNEPAGVEAVFQYLENIDRIKYKAKCNLFFIPIVNPWGWCRNTRHNGMGIDVNRDFKDFKTEEARIVRNHFKGIDFDIACDLHETVSNGCFIYNYSGSNLLLAKSIVDRLKKDKQSIASDYSDWIYEVKDGILDYPTAIVYLQNWFVATPLAQYFFINQCEKSFTFETSTAFDFDSRVKAHLKVINTLIEYCGP